MIDVLCSLVMDLAAWWDRRVWEQQHTRRDLVSHLYIRGQLINLPIGLMVVVLDGWQPDRYV